MNTPAYRYLRGYSLDPGFSTRLDTAGINEVTYKIPFEKLEPGPHGEYVSVIDYDPATRCWYDPVNLDDVHIASQHGLPASEGNPQFHQQLVYAVAMKTIRHFEQALGRKIVWTRNEADRSGREYVEHLRIYPHALRDANAYYDPDKTALLFGYFSAAEQWQGSNYPGGLVFTCLSPDIVAHEVTHAILDSLHPRYMEDTNTDVAAFHEGFADIVALLQRFTFTDLIEHQLYATGGKLDRYSVLGDLATQFGEAVEGNRGALRSMIGKRQSDGTWKPLEPSPSDYGTHEEAHDRGAVLVAAVFDAFQRVYNDRTADLFRIATNGTGVLPDGSINRDLVRRLADEACEIAGRLLLICIRALDYCPPFDITFGDYVRSLITADLDFAPEDESRYRLALIEAVRARGFTFDRMDTVSQQSLRWAGPDLDEEEASIFHGISKDIRHRVIQLAEKPDPEALFRAYESVQAEVHSLLSGKGARWAQGDWEMFLNKLGLTDRPVSELFGANSKKVRFLKNGKPNSSFVPEIEVHSVRPASRFRSDGRPLDQVLVALTQRVEVDVGDEGAPQRMIFRGGATIIINFGRRNQVQYVVQKNIRSYRRFLKQAAYVRGDEAPMSSVSLYNDDDTRPPRINFNLLHRK